MRTKLLPLVAITGTLFIAPASVFGEIYKWVDEAGRTHYSQQKPAAAASVTVIEIQEAYTPPPASHREELERIRELTRQLQAEREAREQRRLQERMLAAAERAHLRPEPPQEAGSSYSYFVWPGYRGYRYFDRHHSGAKSRAFLHKSFKSGGARFFLEFGSGSLRGYRFGQSLHRYPGKEHHGKPWRKRPVEQPAVHPAVRLKSSPKTRGSLPTSPRSPMGYRSGIAITVPSQ